MSHRKRLWTVLVSTALLAAAGAALRGAWALATGPDVSGAWSGSAKGKSSSFDPLVKGGTTTATLAEDFTVVGNGLTGTATLGTDAPADMKGRAGNGTFWALNTGGGLPGLIVVGHADKSGTHLKEELLRFDAAGTVDAKSTVAR